MMICKDYTDDTEENYSDRKMFATEYCEYCGTEIGYKDNACPGCGAPRKELRIVTVRADDKYSNEPKEEVSVSTIILAFIFPPAVLLTRHTWKKHMPKNYRAAKITACISLATLILYITAVM